MMTSLFSVFDPTSSILSNWLGMIFIMIFLPLNKWILSDKYFMAYKILLNKIFLEFKVLTKSFIPGMLMIFLSLFLFILMSNLIGLFPFIFTSTSHMCVSLSLSLMLWFSFNIFGWINNFSHMMAHLVPLGTPAPLMNFMVIIETISSIIRPLTLSVRLTANMIAGHLLISLLGNIGPNSSKTIFMSIILLQFLLIMLELAVAMIQSYVFSILTMLYISEVE